MTPDGPLRAAIFDLDGVLADTAKLHLSAWRRLAVSEGFAFDASIADELRGLSRSASLARLLGDHVIDDVSFQRMLDVKNGWYQDALASLGPDDALPGARTCVTRLAASGWRLAVGSSSRNAATVLAHLQLAPLFDAIVDGNDVEHAKPAPEVFLIAAHRLGVAPVSCVVIEDATSGIEAARNADMAVIGVGSTAAVGAADIVVPSVEDIDHAMISQLVDTRNDQ
ncbi:MAG: beta-phosphoglucomutase [Nitriliruptoraceae bacterium]